MSGARSRQQQDERSPFIGGRLLWGALFVALLQLTGCAIPPAAGQPRALERELADLRLEVQQCRQEIKALRQEQARQMEQLVEVQREAVKNLMQELATSASEALVQMEMSGQAPPTPSSEEDTSRAPPDPVKLVPALLEPSTWIKRVGKNRYQLKRQGLNDTLSNLSQVATTVRMVPWIRNGVPAGFKVYAIRPGSLYYHLGIKNGDVIERINGLEISTPEKALAAYAALRKAERLTLSIRRRGKPLRLIYKVVP